MPLPSTCCHRPGTVLVEEVPGPQGDAGTDGTDGSNGTSAFTLTTAQFVVPAKGNNVTIDVADSSWVIVGQPVFVFDAGTFAVVSVPSATTLQLQYLDYDTNTEAGNAVAVGSGVGPGGFNGSDAVVPDDQAAAYGSGTPYTLTTTSAPVVMGTSSPDVTLTAAGTWVIFARARVDNVGATFAANRTVTAKLRRSNNTAADLANASAAYQTGIITTITNTGMILTMPPVFYSTAAVDDNIELWASIDVLPSAGSITVSQCEIVAYRISDTTP
jgi:hypothetical protein